MNRVHGLTPFGGTELDAVLRNMGTKTLVPVGVSVNVAIMGTCLAACDLGYQIVLPTDAVVGRARELRGRRDHQHAQLPVDAVHGGRHHRRLVLTSRRARVTSSASGWRASISRASASPIRARRSAGSVRCSRRTSRAARGASPSGVPTWTRWAFGPPSIPAPWCVRTCSGRPGTWSRRQTCAGCRRSRHAGCTRRTRRITGGPSWSRPPFPARLTSSPAHSPGADSSPAPSSRRRWRPGVCRRPGCDSG